MQSKPYAMLCMMTRLEAEAQVNSMTPIVLLHKYDVIHV